MEQFIHQENLALYRKRLAETKDDATRQLILKLLADEESKDDIGRPGQKLASAGKWSDAP